MERARARGGEGREEAAQRSRDARRRRRRHSASIRADFPIQKNDGDVITRALALPRRTCLGASTAVVQSRHKRARTSPRPSRRDCGGPPSSCGAAPAGRSAVVAHHVYTGRWSADGGPRRGRSIILVEGEPLRCTRWRVDVHTIRAPARTFDRLARRATSAAIGEPRISSGREGAVPAPSPLERHVYRPCARARTRVRTHAHAHAHRDPPPIESTPRSWPSLTRRRMSASTRHPETTSAEGGEGAGEEDTWRRRRKPMTAASRVSAEFVEIVDKGSLGGRPRERQSSLEMTRPRDSSDSSTRSAAMFTLAWNAR